MHSLFDQTQSPLHQAAPCPCGQSEHVDAWCPPQLTLEPEPPDPGDGRNVHRKNILNENKFFGVFLPDMINDAIQLSLE